MRYVLFLLLIVANLGARAQVVIQGRVVDATSHAPLAFVHVLAEDAREGTTTDIDGRFRLVVSHTPVDVQFSYVGYAPIVATATGTEPLIVRMRATAVQLREAEILPGENPAHRIIQRVHAQRKVNDGMKYRAHRYTSYSKTIFTAALDSAIMNDPEKFAALDTSDREFYDFLEKQHIFLMESATAKRSIPPAAEQEEVLAMRVSGLKDPSLLAIAAQTKTFSVYEPQISISDRTYVGPIGPSSTKHYLFILEDTLYQGGDSTYVISFRPRSGTKFDGLKGLLYVSTDGYALQNVIAEPAEKSGGMSIKVQQVHQRAGTAGPWFPVQLNTFIFLDFVQVNTFRLMGIGRTYLKNIELDVAIERKEVRGPDIVMDKLSTRRDDSFWDTLRTDTLDKRDLMTYHVIDSLGEAENLDQKLKWAAALASGRFPIGPVDLLLDKVLRYNDYEGIRLGLGAATNDKVTRYASIGGYGAYGFKDREWKYGGFLAVTPWPARDIELKGFYENDVAESGGVTFPGASRQFTTESYRWLYVDRMDRIERWGADLSFRVGSSLKLWVGTERAQRVNVIGYEYLEPQGEGITVRHNSFLTGGFNFAARFAFRERLARLPDREVSLGTSWPILYVQAFVAQKGVCEGEYDVWRANAMLEKTFRIRLFGDMHVRLMGGVAQADAPYPFLFDLRGSNGKYFPVGTANTFETMLPNEFLADSYVALHFRHDFGNLLFSTKHFRPRPVVVANTGIGGLSDPELHEGYSFKAFDQPFYEAGLQIDDVLRLGFTGIGVGVFQRFGPLASGNGSDDLAVKLALRLSL